MLAAAVVVLAAAAGPRERSLAEEAVTALRARGIRAEVAEPRTPLDAEARLAEIDDAYGVLDGARATRLAEALVTDAEGAAGAGLSPHEWTAILARRALVARLATDTEAEHRAVARLCAARDRPVLEESDYPRWLREAAADACGAAERGPRARLRVRSANAGAVVRVDGSVAGVAPVEIDVVPGRHAVHVVGPGTGPYGASIEVGPRGASVSAPSTPDPTEGKSQAAAAGFAHRVLVVGREDGVLLLRVEDTMRASTGRPIDVAVRGRELTPDDIDALVRAVSPPERPRPIRRQREAGPPAWIWIAGGAVLVVGGGLALVLATEKDENVRPVLTLPQGRP